MTTPDNNPLPRQPNETQPLLPDPARCRTQLTTTPNALHCLVERPIYCIYACKLGGQYYCTHKNRYEFAKPKPGSQK
jgi:hypothetical protein